MDNVLVRVRNLKKYFTAHQNLIDSIIKGKSKKIIKAIDDVSFDIKQSEIFALIGESGSGKTTVGKTLMKLINVTDGTIEFESEDVTHIKKDALAKYRRRVQMIFQDPYASMNPRFTIKQVLEEPLEIHKIKGTHAEYEAKVIAALEAVKITPARDFMVRWPHMLSGGQRQRVATARTLILEPKLLVADEPVSMIDLSTRAEILHTMRELQQKMNLSYLYITHDLSTARYFADRIAVMYLGRIVEIGNADTIIDNAKHPYTKALIAAVPEPVTGCVDIIKELPISGEIPNPSNIPQGCRFHPRCPYAKEECSITDPGLIDVGNGQSAACIRWDKI